VRPSYEVRAERDGDWWRLTVPAVRGAISQVRRLSDIEDYIRDPIAYVLGVAPDSFDITVNADIDVSDMNGADA
jgi:hypothetical protein